MPVEIKGIGFCWFENIFFLLLNNDTLFQTQQHNDVFNKKRNESNIWFWIASKHRWGQSVGNSKATITTKIKIISNLNEPGNSSAKQTSVAVI